LNRAREARQLVPVNSLWFWDGASTTQVPRPAGAPDTIIAGGEIDPWTAGLAAACGAPLRSATDWSGIEPADGAMLVLQGRAAAGSRQHWQWLDEKWFAPLASALSAGTVPPLHLQIGATAWRLPHRSPLRWLRRRRHWYEQVAA
jgi:hypothetical protein